MTDLEWLCAVQVILKVGSQNARLTIPDSVDPRAAELIRRTWAEPSDRPTFSEIYGILEPLLEEALATRKRKEAALQAQKAARLASRRVRH